MKPVLYKHCVEIDHSCIHTVKHDPRATVMFTIKNASMATPSNCAGVGVTNTHLYDRVWIRVKQMYSV
eukprot:12323838-Karenia_brevis.AAC.1